MKKYIFIAFIVLGLVSLAFLEYQGIIWHNTVFTWPYRVRGLDVSHHQGKIDWKKVGESKNYSFVYIKATEGHDFVDDQFLINWKGAKENGLKVGAYHFFSTRSSGLDQADFFEKLVPKDKNSLPPVIDIEMDINLDKVKTKNDLRLMVDDLNKYYDKKTILYVTYDTYKAYVEGDFDDCPIWIRDIFKWPDLKNREWSMWQYGNRGRVDGINSFVDVNVANNKVNFFN